MVAGPLARRILAALVAATVAMQASCASVGRRKSAAEAASAQLRQGGAGLAPTHQLREWRLEVNSGGFVQLILSSSGVYMMRHGYYFSDKQSGSPVTVMLSESNLGAYSLQGQKLFLHGPFKSSCNERTGRRSPLEMEVTGTNVMMDEFSAKNFLLDESDGRKEMPFHQQFMGTLDRSSIVPAGGRDADGGFESRMGCVQMGPDGRIGFRS
ncbi:MAG: hypothetical protein RIQ81_1993 [Pseudomonadota bacterium]|jgi:hypothetical protein